MIAPATEQDETEAYLEVEDMLFKLAWRYSPHSNEFDDIMGEATLAYVEALASHDPEKSKLSTWIYTCVYFHLLDVRRNAARRPRFATGDHDLDLIPASDSPGNLSRDAQYIFDLCLETDPSGEFCFALGNDRKVNGLEYTAERYRAAGIRISLCRWAKKLGWTVARIVESFDEIREVLR